MAERLSDEVLAEILQCEKRASRINSASPSRKQLRRLLRDNDILVAETLRELLEAATVSGPAARDAPSVNALRTAIVTYTPSGFRDEDGAWHDGPLLRRDALDELDGLLSALEQLTEQGKIDAEYARLYYGNWIAAQAERDSLNAALREVKKYASDPFLGREVALRACLLAANEALGAKA